jgi:cyclopropane-fatty-acyl-phospholipid synthase
LYFQDHLKIDKVWHFSGEHYSKTSWAWLNKMDQNKGKIVEIFSDTYGKENAKKWWQRWRIFFMSCAELFGMSNGLEWGVSHYRFEKPSK